MRIIVPSIGPDCVAARALRCEGVRFELHDVSGDDCAYGRLVTNFWHGGESFAIVEHDIVPWPKALHQMASCTEIYCGYYYQIAGKMGGTLGCTKFHWKLTEMLPNFDARQIPWQRLDGYIAGQILEATGLEDFHRHRPEVAHLHDYAHSNV